MSSSDGAAAERTRDRLVISYPLPRWWIRLGLGLGNLLLRVLSRQFQVFVHSPSAIRETAEARGLKAVAKDSGTLWEIVCLQRAQQE